MNRVHSCIKVLSTWCVGLLCAIALGQAGAALNGAIQTTDSTGSLVNGNIYDSKAAVYLTGGPQNHNDPGLVPDGDYYFQVTDPSGAVLLSQDPIACREVVVSGGRITGVVPAGGCEHNIGIFNSANGEMPVQLCNPSAALCVSGPGSDFADTPNPGGEYKAWLTLVADYDLSQTQCWRSLPSGGTGGDYGFCDSDSKTDNFKVRNAQAAYIVACKFDDSNGNGYLDTGEDLLSGWNITANGVAAGGSDSTTETLMTDETGCVSFTVLDLNGPITLTEQTQTGWIQTAPNASGIYDGYTGDDTGTATVSVPLTAGHTVTVLFGNNNLASEGLLTFNKTAAPTVKYTWGISKSVDKTEIDTSATSATFKYTVSVTHDSGTLSSVSGDINLSSTLAVDVPGVVVTDTIDNGGTCTISPDSNGVSNGDGSVTETVPAESAIKLHYTCTFTSPSSLSGTNTVTVTQEGIQIGLPQTATYALSGATLIDDSITVTDTLGGTLGTVSYTDPSPTTFTYSYTFTGDPAGTCTSHDNTATFTTDTSGTTGSAGQTVKVCIAKDLVVTKDATPSFTRTYNWTITKSVDKTSVEQVGGTATFNYTVTAKETGFTDSGWTVSGQITVKNPNDWESITANVTDALSGTTCTVTNGTGVSIAAGQSVMLSYSCSLSSAAAGPNIATATVTAGITPNSAPTGNKSFTWGAPTTTVNQTVTITDTKPPYLDGTPPPHPVTTLGKLTATDTTPYASGTYTYSNTVNIPATGCLMYDNTATIVETGQIANGQTPSIQVTVCRAPLTMGYWKNHAANSNSHGPSYSSDCSKLKSSSCSTNGPWTIQFLPQPLGTYNVTSILVADPIWGGANCSTSTSQGAAACLAGQLLAAELNIADGACPGKPPISGTITAANNFLISINYIGPTGNYSGMSASQRSTAISLQTTLNTYNNGACF